MSERWSLTESDPGIFTGILKELGVKGLEVEELYGLDAELLEQLEPVKALIFLFKWVGTGDDSTRDGVEETSASDNHYFAHQVITNACGSMALLNCVLNVDDPNVELGDELSNLKTFSEGLDPESRGWTLSSSEKIRSVHNSFARSDPFHLEEARPPSDDEDAYHFIGYLPIGNKLYELDGLRRLPVSHGVIPEPARWTDLAKQVIERRIATYPAGEVMFNLLAVTSRSGQLDRQIETLSTQVETTASGGEPDALARAQLDEARSRRAALDDQFKEWDIDNSLRRHNHVGLIHALLLELAKQGKLEPQIEHAKAEMKRKLAEKEKKGQSAETLMEE